MKNQAYLISQHLLWIITMAKRKFRLPGVEELNKDQDRILRLPENGQFLIAGGPGTGKSVVALLRAIKFSGNDDYMFLTFNNVLNVATKQMLDIKLEANTLLRFFNSKYTDVFKERPDKNYSHNYQIILKQCEQLECKPVTQHLIIDEGQDMSTGYYEVLQYFGYENFFIVADQNQQITDENSSRQELTDLLALSVDNVIELTQNYRNSYPIALMAQWFFTDPASPKPDLPPPSKAGLGTPILYKYKQFNKCIKFILREADRDPSNLIGVVVGTNEILTECKKRLTDTDVELDNEKPVIQSYSSKEQQDVDIDFGEGGIVILNDKSIKGLEFDVVFVMLNGFNLYNNDLDSMRKRFYVMSSRAITKLVFFQGSNNNEFGDIFPEDETILQRKELT